MARGVRGTRGALALVVAVMSLAIPAAAAPSTCAVEGALATGADGWTRIAAPDFGGGEGTFAEYAVDEMRPERIYAVNGVGLAASRDGGCTWRAAAFPEERLGVLGSIPTGNESSAVARRTLLDVRLPYVAAATVWALGKAEVANGATPVVEPRVFVSADGGQSFSLRTTGLPAVARPLALRPGLSPIEAYLLLEETLPTPQRSLWVTADGGLTWRQSSGEVPAVNDFVVDGFRKTLWAWDATNLYASTDRGGTWVRVPTPAPTKSVDVAPLFTTIAFDNGTRVDNGPWGELPGAAPALVTSIAAGPEMGFVASSSTTDGVVVAPPFAKAGAKPLDATPEEATLSRLTLAQTRVDGEYVLYGLSSRALYRRAIPLDFNIPPPPRPEVHVKRRLPPPPGKPSLRPGGSVVTLRPGERRRVGYDIVLPPAPTPLDVFFMTDSTGSMESAIGAVQDSVQDIVDDLTHAGIDLHFGVADFRDWPQTPQTGEDEEAKTYPYKRRSAVGPVGDSLANALASITTGGGQGADSALEAIYQAVTGDGRTGLNWEIPPGQGARFRPEALKVVLVASDDLMREPVATEPWNAGPSMDTVIEALNEHGVEFVGIRVDSGSRRNPRPQMEEVAEGAGSVAPEGGVDCDGDDLADIDAGQPLVCDFSSSDESIAPAFINMLRGIKDLADVHVGVQGPRDVVRHLGDPVFESVNVKAMNTFPVPVEYACTPARYGTDTPVTISGVLRGETLVSGTATIRCLAPPKVAPVVVPPIIRQPPPQPLRAAAVAPPPPPQPNPNVNPNPNPNPQAQGQGGMASQEDQQQQLALADNDVTEDEELAFSAIDPSKNVTPAVTLLAGVLVACAAAGTQLHLARRTRVATNPSRTPF